MNPFMIALAVVQCAATIYEAFRGNKYVAALYLCYTIANILLIIIGSKLK